MVRSRPSLLSQFRHAEAVGQESTSSQPLVPIPTEGSRDGHADVAARFSVRDSPQNPFFKLPSTPRTIARPTDEPTERTTDLIAASVTLWRFEVRGRGADWVRPRGCE